MRQVVVLPKELFEEIKELINEACNECECGSRHAAMRAFRATKVFPKIETPTGYQIVEVPEDE
jgi:hypothetical protein